MDDKRDVLGWCKSHSRSFLLLLKHFCSSETNFSAAGLTVVKRRLDALLYQLPSAIPQTHTGNHTVGVLKMFEIPNLKPFLFRSLH